jgi:hypothetical protein
LRASQSLAVATASHRKSGRVTTTMTKTVTTSGRRERRSCGERPSRMAGRVVSRVPRGAWDALPGSAPVLIQRPLRVGGVSARGPRMAGAALSDMQGAVRRSVPRAFRT